MLTETNQSIGVELPDLPADKPDFDFARKQRQHIKRMYEATKTTLELLAFLDAEEFEVILIQIDGNNAKPLVHIRNIARCSMLKRKHKAYTTGQFSGSYGIEIIWRCDLFGCRVQWVERGH